MPMFSWSTCCDRQHDVAAVGGDIDLVDCERVEVVEIVEKWDSLGGTGQS